MIETILKVGNELKSGFKSAHSLIVLYNNKDFAKKVKKKLKWQKR